MTDSDTTASDRAIGIIPIHFDVPVHYIPFATFDDAASAMRGTIDAFNREFLDGQLEYELLVFPSEEGSFLSRWGIRLLAGYGAICAFTATDLGKGVVKGLTNLTVEELGTVVGSYARSKILEAVNAAGSALKTIHTDPAQCQLETTIITEAAKSFLQTDQEKLGRAGITTQKFRDAYDARNDFYQACLRDQRVKGIGFDETRHFPIKRKDFAKLYVALPPREDQSEVMRWQVELMTLNVTSPNWDREDRKRRWKGRDDKGKECLFQIEDKQFWSLVQLRKIDPRIIDTMKVQLAFVGPQRHHARVLRVLEYNGQILGEPLDSNALDAILGEFNSSPGDDIPDLFRK